MLWEKNITRPPLPWGREGVRAYRNAGGLDKVILCTYKGYTTTPPPLLPLLTLSGYFGIAPLPAARGYTEILPPFDKDSDKAPVGVGRGLTGTFG